MLPKMLINRGLSTYIHTFFQEIPTNKYSNYQYSKQTHYIDLDYQQPFSDRFETGKTYRTALLSVQRLEIFF